MVLLSHTRQVPKHRWSQFFLSTRAFTEKTTPHCSIYLTLSARAPKCEQTARSVKTDLSTGKPYRTQAVYHICRYRHIDTNINHIYIYIKRNTRTQRRSAQRRQVLYDELVITLVQFLLPSWFSSLSHSGTHLSRSSVSLRAVGVPAPPLFRRLNQHCLANKLAATSLRNWTPLIAGHQPVTRASSLWHAHC